MVRRLVIVSLVGLCGCQTPQPTEINFNAPPEFIFDGSVQALNAKAMNTAGEEVADPVLSFSAAPANIVSLSPTGEMSCLKSGDASVIISGAGLSTNFPVKCRMVDSLVMPRELSLTLGNDPVELKPDPLDASKTTVVDVPISIESTDPAVATWSGNKAVPVAVGRAVFKGMAGPATAKTEVVVIQKVVMEPLVLLDGGDRNFTLNQGLYRVQVDVATEKGTPHGVTLQWTGANCEPRPEGQKHDVMCEVAETASLVVANPSTLKLRLGPSVSGNISIFRMPRP